MLMFYYILLILKLTSLIYSKSLCKFFYSFDNDKRIEIQFFSILRRYGRKYFHVKVRFSYFQE